MDDIDKIYGLESDIAFLNSQFEKGQDDDDDYFNYSRSFCDYCGKSYDSKEFRPILESETVHSYKSNLLGAYIEKKTNLYTTHICKRCNKIHRIAGSFHFILFLVLAGLVVYHRWSLGFYSDIYEDYIIPVSFVGLVVYIINIINWVFIKLIFHVRRKPKR